MGLFVRRHKWKTREEKFPAQPEMTKVAPKYGMQRTKNLEPLGPELFNPQFHEIKGPVGLVNLLRQ